MHFFHGLTYFDEILQEADGVILSRGNLGIDLPPEKCNMAGKPAVVTLVVDSMTENLRPPRAEATNVANAILDGNFQFEKLPTTVVAALASDPNVWNAVWENKALQELLQSQNANKEYVADNESVGDTDSQDAAVSSKKLTELSDDENETGNSQTGLMDVINNVKLTVVDMVTNVSAYFKKIFSFSSAEHTPDAADEKAGSSTTEKTLGASLMALAVMVAEVNGEYVVISSRGVQNNIDILSLSYTRHAEDVRHCNMAGKPAVVTLVVDSMTENLRPPRAEATNVANAILDGINAILLGAETLRGLLWLLPLPLIQMSGMQFGKTKPFRNCSNKEYVADNESVGDTDSQDAAVSSKKLTELSDDENETGNSQTGLMDVINNVKLTVVDMVTNVSAYFKKIFSFSSAEHTRDAADENTGSSTTEKTLGASLMALAVMVIMVCKFQEREKQPSILYQKTRSDNPFSSKATRDKRLQKENDDLQRSNAILLGAETLRGLYPTMVAALASDPNVWNAVWENKALQELLQSQNANKEYVADNESVGDTDSQDAAVSSKKLTELSDDENETGNSQTGLMDVINNVKLTVVDMVTNVSAYFKKIFSFSSAEHTPDAADEKAGSSTTEKTLGASLMALAVMVIMVAEVNGEYVVISSRGVQNNIDILSLSYTRHAEDVRHILQEADGVILSRGNLGIDLPPEKNLRPPRAEATDVANAILDGSNAILLGAETLRGLIMEREKQLSIMYQKTRSGNPFSSKATR
ncbi:hypothetical protein NC652_027773 [Populus alba x Populus x berolinensis]|nr:hypothetical protein NC652_027773 [Populus alba x Populus x berolinensis]